MAELEDQLACPECMGTGKKCKFCLENPTDCQCESAVDRFNKCEACGGDGKVGFEDDAEVEPEEDDEDDEEE